MINQRVSVNKSHIKALAEVITNKGYVEKEDVTKILQKLSIKDLRLLVNLLKTYDQKQSVYLTVADKPSKKILDTISETFEGKHIVVTEDKKIGAGIKAQVYDMIYDQTVKSKINHVVEKLEEGL